MPQLGIGSYAYTWSIGVPGYDTPEPMDAFQFINVVAEHKVKVAQIADNIPMHNWNDTQLKQLKAHASKFGISIEVGTRGISADNLERYIYIAEQLSSPILRVVIDTDSHHPGTNEVMQLIRPHIKRLELANVVLAIENHDRFPAKELINILENLNSSHVGVCLDTVNSFGAQEGTSYVTQTLAPYVVNLHVKDFSITRHDHSMGFNLIGTPAGDGMLDVEWVMKQLDIHNRVYNAILELWTPPETTVQETIKKENRWAQQSIAYLRTLIQE